MDLEATAQGGWETQALCPTIVHQGSPGPCREYRAGGLHCCSWARDPGMQDPFPRGCGVQRQTHTKGQAPGRK